MFVGLVPVLIAAGYYAIKRPTDFDPALTTLRGDSSLPAVRIGSTLCSQQAIGVGSLTIGVNAYNADFEAAQSQVWNGALRATYQATYFAWSRGRPTVFTVVRNVEPNGETIYRIRQNGGAPIIRYLRSSVFAGLVGVLFFEVLTIVKKSRRASASKETAFSG